MRQPSKNQLRCFCARKPLLCLYGLDENGRAYVHLRVFKQQRIFGDLVAYGGEVKILCRECIRWHRIFFVGESRAQAELRETAAPPEIDSSARLVETVT